MAEIELKWIFKVNVMSKLPRGLCEELRSLYSVHMHVYKTVM